MARMPTVDAVKAMRGMTLTVRMCRTRELAMRMRVAVWLCRLAAWVANVNFKVEDA